VVSSNHVHSAECRSQFARDYFIATAAVYVPSLVFPWLRSIFEYGIGQKAQVIVEDNDFIRIAVRSKAHWIPGQHCFLRFTGFGIHALTTHPFTLCSLPPVNSSQRSEMVFYVRSRGGFTRKLHDYAMKRPGQSVSIMVDGPYGGIDNSKFWNSDRVVVIAGGSGAGWSLPFVEQFLRLQAQSQKSAAKALKEAEDGSTSDMESNDHNEPKTSSVKSLRVILATRDNATRIWFQHSIAEIVSRYETASAAISDLDVEVYLTGDAKDHASDPDTLAELERKTSGVGAASSSSDDDIATEKISGAPQLPHSDPAHELRGRPDLPHILEKEVAEAGQAKQAVGVFVCGPETMQQSVRNAVAASNLRLASSSNGCMGVYLHLEHFSWA
jgi:NAD(P)H-flavin reductase